MPGNLLHIGFVGMCPHGGSTQGVPGSGRVKVNGQPVLTQADMVMVAGCAFMVGVKPQPCVTAQLVSVSLSQRVKAQGNPVVLSSSVGLCQSGEQIAAGPMTVISSQTRVRGQ